MDLIKIAKSVLERTSLERADDFSGNLDSRNQFENFLYNWNDPEYKKIWVDNGWWKVKTTTHQGFEVVDVSGKSLYPPTRYDESSLYSDEKKILFFRKQEPVGFLQLWKHPDGYWEVLWPYTTNKNEGIGKMMYEYAFSLGFPIKSGVSQTGAANRVWVSFLKRGYPIKAMDPESHEKFNVDLVDGKMMVGGVDIYQTNYVVVSD